MAYRSPALGVGILMQRNYGPILRCIDTLCHLLGTMPYENPGLSWARYSNAMLCVLRPEVNLCCAMYSLG